MNHIEFKQLRNKLELTQTQLAIRLKRTRDMVAKYESGKYPIPEAIAAKVVEFAS